MFADDLISRIATFLPEQFFLPSAAINRSFASHICSKKTGMARLDTPELTKWAIGRGQLPIRTLARFNVQNYPDRMLWMMDEYRASGAGPTEFDLDMLARPQLFPIFQRAVQARLASGLEPWCRVCCARFIPEAESKDHVIKMLQWLRSPIDGYSSPPCPWGEDFLKSVINREYLDVLQWLENQGNVFVSEPGNPEYSFTICTLEELSDKPPEGAIIITNDTVRMAIQKSSGEILQWLYRRVNNFEQCGWVIHAKDKPRSHRVMVYTGLI